MAVCPKREYISPPEAQVSRLMRIESVIFSRGVCSWAVAMCGQREQSMKYTEMSSFRFMLQN
jgi:hypothetical protein